MSALLVTVGVVVTGCSSGGDDAAEDSGAATTISSTTTIASTTTAGDAAGEVITTPGPVELGVGGRATLELEANPTTGYQWELSAEPDAAIVTVISDTYVAGGSDAVGAGGTQRMVIEGVAAGTTTLALRYVRPWESDVDPTDTATYDITVS